MFKHSTGEQSGNSTGNESAEPSSSEHAEAAVGVRLLATSLVVYAQTSKDDQEFIRLSKATAIRILEYIGTEERLRRSEKANGSAPENAQEKVKIKNWNPAGAQQLIFDLYCLRCSFQCWDCPLCGMYRCACYTCGCVLDG